MEVSIGGLSMDIGQIELGNTINNTISKTQDVPENSFEELLDKISSQNSLSQSIFINNLFNMNVSFRVGECTVSKKDWERDDFPFWNYFDKNVKVEDLNNWKSDSKKVSQADIQKSLQKIGFGEMVIIIPDSLKEKMLENSLFAAKILKNIATWKNNYDMMDNAIAANNGLNTSIYQFSKSYCITLNPNGEIDKYVVVGGGLDDSLHTDDDSKNIIHINDLLHRYSKILVHKNSNNGTLVSDSYGDSSPDYLQAMGILASSFQRRNI